MKTSQLEKIKFPPKPDGHADRHTDRRKLVFIE